jgi:hypothetical protein
MHTRPNHNILHDRPLVAKSQSGKTSRTESPEGTFNVYMK